MTFVVLGNILAVIFCTSWTFLMVYMGKPEKMLTGLIKTDLGKGYYLTVINYGKKIPI